MIDYGNKFTINRIIPMSFVDGPGCRTAVFLQGCNMRCLYCHNPETQRQCFNCGKCVPYCRYGALNMVDGKIVYNAEKCRHCDECIKHCENQASPKTALYSVAQLAAEINRNRIFIDGVTFSGGECSLQGKAIVEFARQAEGLHILLDSNMDMPQDELLNLLTVTQGVMADLKSFDALLHQKLTGRDNARILKNICVAAEKGKLAELRTVIVPGYTDAEQEIAALAEYVSGLPGDFCWKLIRFRNFGVRGELEGARPLAGGIMKKLEEIARSGCKKEIIVV